MNDFHVIDRRGERDTSGMSIPHAISNPPQPVKLTLDEMIKGCYLEPCFGRVVVVEDHFTYKGSIHIPESAKRAGTTGIVVKANIGRIDDEEQEHRRSTDEGDTFTTHKRGELVSPTCRVGDRILYGRYGGTPIEFEGARTWRILNENEIIAIVTDRDAKVVDQGI